MGRLVAGFVIVVALSTLRAEAEPLLLGTIDFPNSGAAEAQGAFLEGVKYMHNFEYRDAAEAFIRAQEIDPNFALAYWGEAMTYNHPLWQKQARSKGLDALRKLGRTADDRRAKAPTQREKDYLWAVETLYGETEATKGKPKGQRDDLYSLEMARLHDRYPDDHEIATFYGLSILGTAHEGRDYQTYMRAAAELTTVWDANRNHPGAAHYLIHSYDDSIHAPLGLPMARAYADIAPSAAHAQHMTSHIFVALGMWDDLVKSNERAIEVTNAGNLQREERPVVSGHYPAWLAYGYLQQGRLARAEEMMDAALARINDVPKTSERPYYEAMRARHMIDTEDWSVAERFASPVELEAIHNPVYYFTDALAAIKLGELETARARLDLIDEAWSDRGPLVKKEAVPVLRLEIEGLLLLAEEKNEEAVALLREAAELEREMPAAFGPPKIAKPSFELLGEVLLELGDLDESVVAFETQLRRTPRRTQTLLGLARAAKAAGHAQQAMDTYAELAEIWRDADADVPGFAETSAVIASAAIVSATD